MKTRILAWMGLFAMLIATSNCVHPVFNEPMTVSTKPEPVHKTTLLKPVSTGRCNVVVLFIPIIPDPRKAYEELFEQARAAGGNAVVDFRLSPTKFAYFLVGSFACWEATGMAAIVE